MTIFVVFPESESLNATIVSHGETIHWSEPLLRRMSKFVLPDGWVWRGEIASSVNALGSSLLKSDRWAFPLFQRTGLAGSSAASLAKYNSSLSLIVQSGKRRLALSAGNAGPEGRWICIGLARIVKPGRRSRHASGGSWEGSLQTAGSGVELGGPFFLFSPDVIITHSYLYERTCSARVEGWRVPEACRGSGAARRRRQPIRDQGASSAACEKLAAAGGAGQPGWQIESRILNWEGRESPGRWKLPSSLMPLAEMPQDFDPDPWSEIGRAGSRRDFLNEAGARSGAGFNYLVKGVPEFGLQRNAGFFARDNEWIFRAGRLLHIKSSSSLSQNGIANRATGRGML